MRAIFKSELSQVGEDLTGMSRLVRTAISGASYALTNADLAVAQDVITADDRLDDMQRELDERCVMLLARQQPVASDLRLVVSALRMSASMERMGDLARHIAQTARRRHPGLVVPPAARDLFDEFALAATTVADELVLLLTTHDLTVAADIITGDDVFDALQVATFHRTHAPEWSGDVAHTVDVTLLARFYERFGDHAVSVAQRVDYLVTGNLDA